MDVGDEGALIRFLEVIRKVVEPPILRREGVVDRKKKNDFHLGKN